MIRLGAVGYLNARPLVYGLDRVPGFQVRYDIPAECARLLHAHDIDVGLIPSIEYLRGPQPYAIVAGAGVTSNGPVASVAIYTRRDPGDIRTIAMDSSSRTSVALATILLRRVWGIAPQPISMPPDLETMLAGADAALIIGDVALFLDHPAVRLKPDTTPSARSAPAPASNRSGSASASERHATASDSERSAKALAERSPSTAVRKIDLGELWTQSTGLPFVYAVWTGWPGAATADDVAALQRARDEGVAHADEVARAYYPDDAPRQAAALRYLRDNIRYQVGGDELEGLRTFYRYAAELSLATFDGSLRFF